MEQEFGFKELYDVTLKTTYPIEIEGKNFETGETVAAFDRIQFANFNEIKRTYRASGGYDNRPRVMWEETKEVQIRLQQGIFSKVQLALMTNSKLFKSSTESIKLSIRESLESDEDGIITLKHAQIAPVFIYESSSGNKIENYSVIDEKHLQIQNKYCDVIVDYWYEYSNGFKTLKVGQALSTGYFTLIGKTKTQDDETGAVRTALITIPKLKLVSDLSIRLGENANPVVGVLDAIAMPVGDRDHKQVMDLVFLNDDIDSDM